MGIPITINKIEYSTVNQSLSNKLGRIQDHHCRRQLVRMIRTKIIKIYNRKKAQKLNRIKQNKIKICFKQNMI